MRIAQEDIVAIYVDNGALIVCSDCYSDAEFDDATEDATKNDIITQDVIEDSEDLFFCDRCDKRL